MRRISYIADASFVRRFTYSSGVSFSEELF